MELGNVCHNLKLARCHYLQHELRIRFYEIVLDKNQLANDIYLTYHPTYYFKYLLKEIDEQKIGYIIGNISSILQTFYIYIKT